VNVRVKNGAKPPPNPTQNLPLVDDGSKGPQPVDADGAPGTPPTVERPSSSETTAGLPRGVFDTGFKSGFPTRREGSPVRPTITPKLQQEFSKFISQWDLTKESGTIEVPVEGGLLIQVSISPKENEVKVWIFKEGTDGSLATLTADSKGELKSLTNIGLSVSGLTRESVALIYEKAPKLPMRDALIEAFHIPEVTPEMRVKEQGADVARAAHQVRLATVKPTRTRVRKSMVDPQGAVEVFTHEFAMTRPGKGRSRYIQTFSAGPCVILSLYDPETKTGLVAHFDATTDVKASFHSLTAGLQRHEVDISRMKARIVGGQTGRSEELILGLRDQIKARQIEVVEEDIIESSFYVSNVVLDTQTGELYDYEETSLTRSKAELDIASLKVQLNMGKGLSFHRSPRGLE